MLYVEICRLRLASRYMRSDEIIQTTSASPISSRYRQATRDMNARYPDATSEEVAREDVCIICREEMRLWRQPNVQEAPQRDDGGAARVTNLVGGSKYSIAVRSSTSGNLFFLLSKEGNKTRNRGFNIPPYSTSAMLLSGLMFARTCVRC